MTRRRKQSVLKAVKLEGLSDGQTRVKVETTPEDALKVLRVSERLLSRGPLLSGSPKRARFFVDAVVIDVIVKRVPDAHFKFRYEPLPTQPTSVKRERPSPKPTTPRPSRARSSTPQQGIKIEAKIKDSRKAKAKSDTKVKRTARAQGHLFDEEFKNSRFEHANIPKDPFPIGVDQATRDAGAVPRYFMSGTYGGNPNIMCPTPSPEKLAEHGYDDFMFLALDRQPEAPRILGNHGLWLQIGTGRAPQWEHGIMRLFTRVSDKPARWLYQGQYEVKRSFSMTREEWARQSPAVRNKWIGDFHTKDVGGYVRAWIYYKRSHDSEPTDDEVTGIVERKHDKRVTKEEIALAFTQGHFTLMVYTLKCVGYDCNFQREVIEKHSSWVHVPKSKGGKKQPVATTAREKTEVQSDAGIKEK